MCWAFTRSRCTFPYFKIRTWPWLSEIWHRGHKRPQRVQSQIDVSLLYELLEVRKLLMISTGYIWDDRAITAHADGDAITLEFDGSNFKLYDTTGTR